MLATCDLHMRLAETLIHVHVDKTLIKMVTSLKSKCLFIEKLGFLQCLKEIRRRFDHIIFRRAECLCIK